MMFEVKASGTFSAAHHIPKHAKCQHVHGHNYRVVVTLRGDVNDRGFLADFGVLDCQIQSVCRAFDHGMVNDILETGTAEAMARYIFAQMKSCEPLTYRVDVWETDNYCASYWQ